MLPAREFHTRRLAMELNCSHTCKESQGYHLRVLCSKLSNFAIDNFRVKYNTISESSDSNILQGTKGKKKEKILYIYRHNSHEQYKKIRKTLARSITLTVE